MILDMTARRNLELTETMRDRSRKGSLLWVLDRTMTSMGARTLRSWVEQPLIISGDINERLDAVEELRDKFMVRMELRELFRRIYDIERLISRIVLGNANCRDLIALKNSIGQIPYIKKILENCGSALISKNNALMDELSDVFELIERAIIDDPPISVKEGGIIKPGFNEEVDRLKDAATNGKEWILSLEAREREKTGIKNLRIGYTKVFGYYIEVTKSYFHLVPQEYIRKQTLANCERYVTQELKWRRLSGASRSWNWNTGCLSKSAGSGITGFRIKQTAVCIAELDAICSPPRLRTENYCAVIRTGS